MVPHASLSTSVGSGGSRRLAVTLALAAFLLLLAFAAPGAHAAWNEPVGGESPINHREDRSGYEPNLTTIGGVPYVAWSEHDDTHRNVEIRVSRLNAAGTAWEEVVGGSSPINHSTLEHGNDPSLTGIDGVPYVAWHERVARRNHNDIRVSRLNAAGTEWEELGGGPVNGDVSVAGRATLAAVDGVPYVAWADWNFSGTTVHVSRLNAAGTAWEEVAGPINEPGTEAFYPSLTVIDGVPYVAREQLDGTNGEIRVSRLNAAGTAWEEVAGGASPINHDSDQGGSHARLTSIGGVPYVAWLEGGDAAARVRVSRLNAAGTAWEELVGGDNPFNQAEGAWVGYPSLAAIGGVPYVAWTENDGAGQKLRVSRLNASETAWVEVVGGSSPINHASDQPAYDPSLSAVGGVPYVAWPEPDEPYVNQIRVSRLEPDFLSQTALATDTDALLLSRVRTYGVAYPIAFQYGTGTQLDHQTAATPTAYDDNEDVVFQPLTGLTPGTDYSWRPIGFDGLRATGIGPTGTFSTLPGRGSRPHGHRPHDPRPHDPQAEPAVKLLVAVLRPKLRAAAGRSVTVRYLLTSDADVRLEVRRCGGRLVASVPRAARAASSAPAGRNRITWNGKIGRTRARPGCYVLTVTATSSDGQSASDDSILHLTRRTRGSKSRG